MCGIFVFFSKSDQSVLSPELIKHRGPDETRGLNVKVKVNGGTGTVQLQFHRLSINGTIVDASQPFNHDNEVYLLANGEIYNHLELEQNPTIGESDCAVILEMYLKHGIEYTIKMLDGEFAFSIVDLRNRTIVVGRDHIGVRSLYYMKKAGSFAVCSELKGLVSKTPSASLHGASQPVDQFPNRHYGIYNMDTEEFKLYAYDVPMWSPERHEALFLPGGADSTPESELTCEIGGLLFNAVKKRLMCDRKTSQGTPAIGAFLSGGFDSSIVAALAQDLLIGPIHTFSIGFKDAPDLLAAREVARHIGSIHHEYVVTKEYMLSLLPEVVRQIESYDITTVRASTFMYALSKYIREEHPDIVVLLSGEGPDEASGSYMYFYNAPSYREFFDETMRLLDDLRYFDCLRGDKATAGHSLEIRVPFLDKDFLEYYMLSVHPKFKLIPRDANGKGGMEKYILRKSFDGWKNRQGGPILPSSIIWRPKEAMSDGVSQLGEGLSWFQIIQSHISNMKRVTECAHAFGGNSSAGGVAIEREWYREIFNAYYPGCSHLIPYYWLPRWSYTADGRPVEDPSARVLSVYRN
jgi:asparagine synthase (glutamine-hydrolysing)